ncbi:hypothetical protein FXN61_23970 [Lentzea sp. PSKA42]|uniref:TubC N-terminal docking domain-containing protein n=1 Tax=Lentzea indica TaxID=2604800 RepID=A0ABX1FL96_9PSEU|nr:hypothetical protein [Lentzea indica]NKE59700.1 hypothetical protein [Lentzea indica]
MSISSVAQVLRADGLFVIDDVAVMDDCQQLNDLELLSTALQDALAAQASGEVIGPEVDELTLRRAERRARRADARRSLDVQVLGGAA